MKTKIRIFTSFFVIFALFSCTKHQVDKNNFIKQAENIFEESPDSALNLLTKINEPEKLSKSDYAEWCLLYTHVLYKLDQKIENLKLINTAINYFKNTKQIDKLGTAYYLEGCILNDLKKNDLAMLNLKNAREVLFNSKNFKLKGLVAFNLGYVCLNDEIFSYSLSYFHESLEYFLKANDKLHASYSYREIADMYKQLEYHHDSILVNLDKAIDLAYQAGDSTNYYFILGRKGEFLLDSDPKQSKNYLLKASEKFPNYRSYYAAQLAFAFSKLNNQDSAKYFLKISLADNINELNKIKIYNAAAQIAINDNNYKDAYDYMRKSFIFRDSIFRQNLKTTLYKVDKRYDLTQKEKENADLSISNRNKIILISILIIIVLFIFTIYLSFIIRNKKRLSQLELERQKLQYDAERSEIMNEQKQELLKIALQNKISNTLQFNRLKNNYLQKNKIDSFIHEVANQSIIHENEWTYYIEEVDNLFEQKITKLKNDFNELTSADLIVISIICLNVSIIDACNILEMTKNTMYMRRKTIKKRLKLNAETNLDEWIQQNLMI